VDTHRHALTRDGVPIDLSPRYVQVLAYLLSHPGKVISKNARLDTVWANVFVTENTANKPLSAIRKVLDDDWMQGRLSLESLNAGAYGASAAERPTQDSRGDGSAFLRSEDPIVISPALAAIRGETRGR
jgi:hypothetical protein